MGRGCKRIVEFLQKNRTTSNAVKPQSRWHTLGWELEFGQWMPVLATASQDSWLFQRGFGPKNLQSENYLKSFNDCSRWYIPVINDCPKWYPRKNNTIIHWPQTPNPRIQKRLQRWRWVHCTSEAHFFWHDRGIWRRSWWHVTPNQQLHFAAYGVADVFQSDFWKWHTPRHIKGKLIDWIMKTVNILFG